MSTFELSSTFAERADICEKAVGPVPWLPKEVGGLLRSLCAGDVGDIGETGLKFGDSTTVALSRMTSLALGKMTADFAGADRPSR